ncbi:MAG: hypothetical protein AAGB29_06265 [Planctomycetota bacterium]
MRLEQADRLLVLLHYADGLSVSEIAVLLDEPKADVSDRLDGLRWRLAQVMRDASAQARPDQVEVQGSDDAAAAVA